jgi:class 3 adenylate cyclase/alpha-beta hydrolase superfamily lysophospholipase
MGVLAESLSIGHYRCFAISCRAGLDEDVEVDRSIDTNYVRVSDGDVAYQVVGDDGVDLLYFYGLGSHVEHFWDMPLYAEFLARLASFTRLIVFDRRGTGASDDVPELDVPIWEEWTEDVRAVLDAAGSTRAAIFAGGDAGPIALLFTAMHPERVRALILFNTAARYLVADDYPIGISPELVDGLVAGVSIAWGTPDAIRAANPDRSDDIEFITHLARQFRSAATPRAAAAQYDYIWRSLDVRQALPLISVPTLILHVAENPLVPVAYGRYLADHIAGAVYVELPGRDYAAVSSGDAVSDEIAEFVTGQRTPGEIDRILTTVMFTDIGESTARAADLGDRRWRRLLDAHDRTAREQLRRFGGREINTTGDGFVACFDRPARAIRCAQAIVYATRELGIYVRAGLHTGECDVRGDDLGGIAVHIASRVGASATPGEVLVSGTVRDLVFGSSIEFEPRGERELKGVPGRWKLLAVTSP